MSGARAFGQQIYWNGTNSWFLLFSSSVSSATPPFTHCLHCLCKMKLLRLMRRTSFALRWCPTDRRSPFLFCLLIVIKQVFYYHFVLVWCLSGVKGHDQVHIKPYPCRPSDAGDPFVPRSTPNNDVADFITCLRCSFCLRRGHYFGGFIAERIYNKNWNKSHWSQSLLWWIYDLRWSLGACCDNFNYHGLSFYVILLFLSRWDFVVLFPYHPRRGSLSFIISNTTICLWFWKNEIKIIAFPAHESLCLIAFHYSKQISIFADLSTLINRKNRSWSL